MIKLPIKNQLIAEAKDIAKEFDSIKVYEKLQCNNNWLGVLGELMFKEWLKENRLLYEHIDFLKTDCDQPDFIVNNVSIDIKTTFDTKLWIQKPIHDLYILCRVNDDLEHFYIIGYITRKELEERINKNKLRVIQRGERKDYVVYVNELAPIGLLYGELTNAFTKKMR